MILEVLVASIILLLYSIYLYRLLKFLIPQISIEYLIDDPNIWRLYYTKLSIERETNRNYLYNLNQGITSTNNNYLKLPINYKLRNYQIEGIKWMMYIISEMKCNGILADEMGLGKTLQTISLLGYLKQMKLLTLPHLIIVPKSTLGNWINEIKRWCPLLKPLKFHGDAEERENIKKQHLSV